MGNGSRGVSGDAPAFGAISALGSEHLAELLSALLEDPENAAVYGRLRQMLFTVTLMDAPEGEMAGEGTDHDAAAILQGLTDPTLAWVYRPVSYLHRLCDGWTAMHVEHSTVDGATLVEAVRRMQDVAVAEGRVAEGAVEECRVAEGAVEEGGDDAPPATTPVAEVTREAGEGAVVGKELAWEWPPELREKATTLLGEVATQAADLRVDVVRTRKPDVQAAGMRVSLDAVQQLVMALAQHLAYGHVRGHYESVDMREYQAGRTECLRPVTPELIALVEALAGGPVEERTAEGRTAEAQVAGAWRELLTAALDAHRGWVKACKAGRGVDRHLFGLGLAAEAVQERSEALAALVGHPAVQAAREDFLSTTSIGSAAQVVRYAFAPTAQDGFGIAYTPGEDWLEFTVSHWAGRAVQPQRFLTALERAAERVDALLRTVGRGG